MFDYLAKKEEVEEADIKQGLNAFQTLDLQQDIMRGTWPREAAAGARTDL